MSYEKFLRILSFYIEIQYHKQRMTRD